MKYCIVNTKTDKKVTRMLSFKMAQWQKQNNFTASHYELIDRAEAVIRGYIVDSIIRTIKTYFPIQFVNGLDMYNYKEAHANNVNTKNYEDFCRRNALVIPV